MRRIPVLIAIIFALACYKDEHHSPTDPGFSGGPEPHDVR